MPRHFTGRPQGRPRSTATTFKCGHEKTVDNTYIRGDGYTTCRTCRNQAPKGQRYVASRYTPSPPPLFPDLPRTIDPNAGRCYSLAPARNPVSVGRGRKSA